MITFLILPGAAAGAPNPPEGLQMDPESNSVSLEWHPPPDTTGLDHYYVYIDGEEMKDETNDTHYIWNDLDSCTSYIFGVRSVSAEGDMSDPLLGKAVTLDGSKLCSFHHFCVTINITHL